MANDKRNNAKASCAICGVQAGQHSLREGGVCDGIRRGYIDATTKLAKDAPIVDEPIADLEEVA